MVRTFNKNNLARHRVTLYQTNAPETALREIRGIELVGQLDY